ncbi:MAG: hypothetical protein NVV70_06530 [Cellulomonas sp.]|nr:hypothetical protein [Cellulomonas sp.]MCR6647800.1 hypothetical protein [Cellulomonas sp.]
MSVGAEYTGRAARAVVGPARSTLFPSVLHVGWLDGAGSLIAMSGRTVAQSNFAESAGGVANVAAIDAGVAGGAWTIAAVGLFDAASGGSLVLAAAAPAAVEVSAGQSLSIPAGGLVFTVVA